ncbi:hypothetical protein BKA66DRAFT_182366 [Pyrenochaeta sp. MPI-SDFR-AT-0127]|nr:hypothetical protein BKA66DRAFT_182366 [Pyrenochaeta sp. MPI-SDFR-AT-0127]
MASSCSKCSYKRQGKAKQVLWVTSGERGFLFNCATILDPTQKLTAYEDETWTHLISSLIANNSSNTSNDMIIESILLSPYQLIVSSLDDPRALSGFESQLHHHN